MAEVLMKESSGLMASSYELLRKQRVLRETVRREMGLAVPCENRGAGCKVNAAAEEGHEDECPFRKVYLVIIQYLRLNRNTRYM